MRRRRAGDGPSRRRASGASPAGRAGSPQTHRLSRGGRLRAAGKRLVGTVLVLAVWWAATALLQPQTYVFPTPQAVGLALVERGADLARHAAITASEIVLGLAAGLTLGVISALAIAASPLARRLMLPIVVVSQTLPVFAIAPLLVVWLGYGIASKVVMATLIIYFPIATAFAEGMLRADRALIDLARLNGASARQILFLIRAPAGLPGLAAGLKLGASVAPIGAVVGEWVGSSAGLGHVMLHANARFQTDVLFAALFLLAALALLIRAAADAVADRLAPWQPDDTLRRG